MSDTDLLALALAPKKCKRVKRNGQPCGNWARRGQEVCGYHGGSAKHCLIAAERRLNRLTVSAVKKLGWAMQEAQRTGNLMPLIAACKLILEYAPGFGTATDSARVTNPDLQGMNLEQLLARSEEQAQMIRRTLDAQRLASKLLGTSASVLDAEVLNDDAAITSTITPPVTSSIDTDLPADRGLNNLHPRSESEVPAATPKEVG